MKNIVIIGMPGSGKSTVGQRVARALGRTFLETDELIVRREGRSIPEIFASAGESCFRDAETEAARDAASQRGLVISTGGGLILRPENMELLSQNGLVFFLDRDPADIAKGSLEGRPLIGNDKERVFTLYTQRIHLYRKYAQYTILGGATAAETAARLLDTIRTEGLLS